MNESRYTFHYIISLSTILQAGSLSSGPSFILNEKNLPHTASESILVARVAEDHLYWYFYLVLHTYNWDTYQSGLFVAQSETTNLRVYMMLFVLYIIVHLSMLTKAFEHSSNIIPPTSTTKLPKDSYYMKTCHSTIYFYSSSRCAIKSLCRDKQCLLHFCVFWIACSKSALKIIP